MAILLQKWRRRWPMNSGENNFRSTDGFPASIRISKMCRAVRWQLQNKKFLLLGSISVPGLCSTHLSNKAFRDIEASLRVPQPKLYHMGFRAQVSRNTLANANQVRDWRIYADFAQVLIHIARSLFMPTKISVSNWIKLFTLWIPRPSICVWPFSLGQNSQPKRGREVAYPPGFAREYSYRDLDYSWKSPRHTNSRSSMERTRGHLSHGSWLCRFCGYICN